MRILVYKNTLAWPRRSGHDVHTYEMMRAWIRSGVHVNLITSAATHPQAIDGLDLDSAISLADKSMQQSAGASGLAGRYIRYWGVNPTHIAAVAQICDQLGADAVVASGLDALPFLHSIRDAVRVWYAADEWFWHHLSLLRPNKRLTWQELKPALVKGLYERVFRPFVDRAWVVSEVDRRFMRLISGIPRIDIIPNGVDTEYYAPVTTEHEVPESAVFWGRLDFQPNVQGLEWFCSKVWPAVIARHPAAVFTIIGANPIREVFPLEKIQGVRLLPNLADLRPEVARHQAVVLPFISGGGIKNKLLEGAAMGKPIICSGTAAAGLKGKPPLIKAGSKGEWLHSLERLWSSRSERSALSATARQWVCAEHTWERAGASALNSIQTSMTGVCGKQSIPRARTV